MTKMKDLSGQKIGRLTVIKFAHRTAEYYKDDEGNIKIKRYRYYYLCKCECGNTKIIEHSHLKGDTLSCGCLRNEKVKSAISTHNLSGTKLYQVWGSIIQRCCNEKCKQYPNYGGRGINICDEWKNDYEKFYNWSIKNGYKDGLTIDRIDNNKGYNSKNCRWVTQKIQARNTRRNRFITYDNHTYCMAEWAEKLNLPADTLKYKLNKGMTIDEIKKETIIWKRYFWNGGENEGNK